MKKHGYSATRSGRALAGIPPRRVWTPLSFGKHEGKTLPEVAFRDPGWIFWALANGAMREMPSCEVNEIAWKVRAIKVVPEGLEDVCVVEYVLHHDGLFDHVEIVPVARERGGERSRALDLFFADWQKGYDKKGALNLVRDLKWLVFGDPSIRMNRRRCEDFFSDDNNFLVD